MNEYSTILRRCEECSSVYEEYAAGGTPRSEDDTTRFTLIMHNINPSKQEIHACSERCARLLMVQFREEELYPRAVPDPPAINLSAPKTEKKPKSQGGVLRRLARALMGKAA